MTYALVFMCCLVYLLFGAGFCWVMVWWDRSNENHATVCVFLWPLFIAIFLVVLFCGVVSVLRDVMIGLRHASRKHVVVGKR
jgi:hypothetical protein